MKEIEQINAKRFLVEGVEFIRVDGNWFIYTEESYFPYYPVEKSDNDLLEQKYRSLV